MSLTANALVTGLIVLRIFMVYKQVKPTFNLDDQDLLDTNTSGRKLLSIMFIILESGMGLFIIQLVRLVLYTKSAESNAIMQSYAIVLSIDQMLHVIIDNPLLLSLSYFY